MRRMLFLAVGLTLPGALLGLGLWACGSEPLTDFECDCEAGQTCTYTGICLDACTEDGNCGSCGLCQDGYCVRTAACDFVVNTDSPLVNVDAGDSATVGITLTRSNDYADDVVLGLRGDVPEGLSGTFDPNPIVGSGISSTLTLTASAATNSDVVEVVVQGSAAGLMASTVLVVDIAGASSGFELIGPTAPLTLTPGGAADAELDISRFGGNVEAITFSLSDAPAEITAEFAPQPAQQTDPRTRVTLWADPAAIIGSTSVTVSGSTPTGFGTEVTLAVEVQALAIAGVVVDTAGLPVAGATVALDRDFDVAATTTTDSGGAFSFGSATAPYTLTVVTADQLTLMEIEELTTATPVIGLAPANGPMFGWLHTAPLTGAVTVASPVPPESFGLPLDLDQRIAIGGTGNTYEVAETVADGTINADLRWFGPEDQFVTLVAVEYELTTPATFGAYGVAATPTDLSDGSTASVDIEINTAVTTMSIDLSWTTGAYSGDYNSGGLNSFDLAGAHFPVGLLPGSEWRSAVSPFTLVMPAEAAGLTVDARTRALVPGTSVGVFQVISFQPVTPAQGPPTLTVDLPDTILLWPIDPPDAGPNAVPLRPTLHWSGVQDAAVYFLTIEEDGAPGGPLYHVTLAGDVNRWRLPDYGPLGMELTPDGDYRWSVQAIVVSPYRTDDVVNAEAGGFGSLLYGGRTGLILNSGSSRFTTVACLQTNGGVEMCDGVDNDCNLLVDDVADVVSDCASQYPSAPNVIGWGCAAGCRVVGCSSSTADVDADPANGCEATCTTSGAELCDYVDNDCNGTIDEGYAVWEPCGVGDCAGGFLECLGAGTGTVCSTELGGSMEAASVEICDNRDNDCNGIIDDGLTACLCADGFREPDAKESCDTSPIDAIDDDCNGLIDDNCCGNGILDPIDECEKFDFGGQTCTNLGIGFVDGPLRCTDDCSLDTSSCSDTPIAHLIISEVYHDAPSSDDRHEWVELYNPTLTTVDFAISPHVLVNAGLGYTHSSASELVLLGSIAPGGCFVVGGPDSDAASHFPTYDQAVDFSPDLQSAGSPATAGETADAVALFNLVPTDLDEDSIPVDAVVYGDLNTNGLIDETGGLSDVDVGDIDAGSSLERTSTGWVIQATPSPGDCSHVDL